MAVTRLMLVDDHTLFRKGTRMLLESEADFKVVAEAADGREALELARRHMPDVVAMDVAMEGGDGIEATRAIVSELPETRVVVVTMHGDDDVLYRALAAGAAGYILKESAPDELATAIQAVAAGGYYLTPSLTKRLVQRLLRQSAHSVSEHDFAELTDRERDVLALIGDGLTNREIADRLSLTTSTVQTHRTHIMRRLGLESRADLMRAAVQFSMVGADAAPG